MFLKHFCRTTPPHAGCTNFFAPLFVWIAFLQLIVVADPVHHSSSIGGRNLLNETPLKIVKFMTTIGSYLSGIKASLDQIDDQTVEVTKNLPSIFLQGKFREQLPVPRRKDSIELFPQARRHLMLQKKERLSTELAKQDEVQDPVPEEETIKPLEYREPKKSVSLVQTMRDQIESAKMFLSFARINNRHRLLRDLKLQIRDNEKTLGNSLIDADLPKSATEKIKALDGVLAKAKDQRKKCEALVKNLRSLILANEEKVQVLKEEVHFLGRLAARTMPKGLHCLALQLTIKYYNQPKKLPVPTDERKLGDPQLYHYAIFSENILAASVVVNSTIFYMKEPHKHVFHILTDGLNYAAMKMWFWANTHGGAIVEVKNLDDLRSLHFNSPFPLKIARRYLQPALSKLSFKSLKKHESLENLGHIDPLQLYLPDIFPNLDKIILLDDDIVVRKDLTGLWKENLNGKVSGAVTSCGTSNHYVDRLLNFSSEVILDRVDLNAWVWRYCIHIFDLKEWKRRNFTETYNSVSLLSQAESVAGTVPHGLVTVHNNTHTLDNFWNVLTLDDIPDAKQDEIQNAAAIHYGGYVKPWLETNVKSYKYFWTRFVNYENPLLQECNINK